MIRVELDEPSSGRPPFPGFKKPGQARRNRNIVFGDQGGRRVRAEEPFERLAVARQASVFAIAQRPGGTLCGRQVLGVYGSREPHTRAFRTCRPGSMLPVHGLAGPRIVDASAMPRIASGRGFGFVIAAGGVPSRSGFDELRRGRRVRVRSADPPHGPRATEAVPIRECGPDRHSGAGRRRDRLRPGRCTSRAPTGMVSSGAGSPPAFRSRPRRSSTADPSGGNDTASGGPRCPGVQGRGAARLANASTRAAKPITSVARRTVPPRSRHGGRRRRAISARSSAKSSRVAMVSSIRATRSWRSGGRCTGQNGRTKRSSPERGS